MELGITRATDETTEKTVELTTDGHSGTAERGWAARRRARATAVGILGAWLLLLGLVAGCGGGDDDDSASDENRTSGDGQAAQEPEEDEPAATTTTEPATTTTTTPRVVYEVVGSGTVAVNYSISGDRQQSREVTLPWSEEQVEEPSRLSMLVALVGSEGDVTCRIRRGDEVLAEATLSGTAGPLLPCDYPPTGESPVTFPPGM